MTVARDVPGASGERFDVIVVGGGVYGAMLLLESARRGLRAVGVERDDFGGATSWNHLRILHGGLRYLQHFDLVRHRESVEERRRFLAEFGGFVRPLPCWMPLDWKGQRNPLAMRAAAKLDHWLSLDRNDGLPAERALAQGRVWYGADLARHTAGWGIGPSAAALRWFDVFVPRPRRLLMEILHRACDLGAMALNHAQALAPLLRHGVVEGLRVLDRLDGSEFELRAPLVLNATGPEAGALVREWQCATPRLDAQGVAWNVLLDIAPAFDEALAVAAPRRGAPVLFLVPWEGRLLAGTGHAAAPTPREPAVPAQALSNFLEDLAAAAPGLGIHADRVLRIYRGFLPATHAGSAELSRRPAIVDHSQTGGPRGLWSVAGVKLTTARRVAEQTLRRAVGSVLPSASDARSGTASARLERLRFGPDWRPDSDPSGLAVLRAMIRDESVVHLDDLLFRRTALGDDPRTARLLAPQLSSWFGPDAANCQAECDRVTRALADARQPLA